jgi:uncharacterized Zn finger protein (UPF0148 family)
VGQKMKIEFTEEELMTIYRLCDYMIASRDKKSIQASGKGGIIAKTEALLEKIEKILHPKCTRCGRTGGYVKPGESICSWCIEEEEEKKARDSPIKRYKRAKAALNSLKGIGDEPVEHYLKELKDLNERIMDIIHTRKTGIGGIDLIHQVMPESFGKTDEELDPYIYKYKDAMSCSWAYLSKLSTERWSSNHEHLLRSRGVKT